MQKDNIAKYIFSNTMTKEQTIILYNESIFPFANNHIVIMQDIVTGWS
jgi:hypothetical protein